MAQIPGADTLGQSEGTPDIAPVTYPRQFGRPNQMGEAISESQQKLAETAQRQQDQESEFEYGVAKSNFLIGKAQLLQQVSQDPDWKTADQRYNAGMADLTTAASSAINNPKFQRQFSIDSKTEAADGLLKVQEFQRGREKEDGLGTLDNTLAANRTAALADPSTAPQIVQSTQSAIDGAVAKGWLTEPQGVKARLSWLTDYGKGYVDSLPDSEAVQVLGKSLPQRGAGQAAPVDIKTALIGQESGGRANVPDSVTGAMGTGQVEPDTWKRFAKPGEDPHNKNDSIAVSGRYVDYLSGLPNVKGDPARIAVGYFSGEKNIAPLGSPTPWIRDKADPTGKKTSSYVSDVLGRTGQAPKDETTGQEQPLSAPTGTPVDFLDVPTRATMLREAQARLRSDNAAGVQEYVSSTRDTISYLQAGGDPSKVTITAADIGTHVPGQEGAGLADEFNHALDYNKAVTEVATKTPEQVNDILAGHEPQGPSDFRENQATFEALQKAAQARQSAIFGTAKGPGDPAGYAISVMKDVGAAYTQAISKPGPDAFDAYVKRINGAYQTLGVPPELRSVLPRDRALGTVAEISSAAPAQAVAKIQALQQESGKWWPAVYRDLARAGLPPAMQAVNVAADSKTLVDALQYEADAKAKTGKGLLESLKGESDTDGHPIVESVDKAIAADQNLNDLRSSFGISGAIGSNFYVGIRNAVRTTALYLYSKGGITPEAAAAKASAAVTGNFDFVQQPGNTPARIPKGMSDDFKEATTHTLANLTEKDVRPYAHEQDEEGKPIEGVPKEQLSEHALRGAKAAYWVSVPGDDGNGAVRAIDPQTKLPVILSNGKPLDIPYARFNFLATQSRKVAKAGEDENVAAMSREAMEK